MERGWVAIWMLDKAGANIHGLVFSCFVFCSPTQTQFLPPPQPLIRLYLGLRALTFCSRYALERATGRSYATAGRQTCREK